MRGAGTVGFSRFCYEKGSELFAGAAYDSIVIRKVNFSYLFGCLHVYTEEGAIVPGGLGIGSIF